MSTQAPTAAAAEQRSARRVNGAIEQPPDASRKLRIGRFSSGSERRPDAPGKRRRGSFADGYTACS